MRIETINGRELKFDPEQHKYWLDGNEVPSVTTITGQVDKSEPLMGWAVNTVIDYLAQHVDEIRDGSIVLKGENAHLLFSEAKAQHRELKKAAADMGTRVHRAVELYLKGEDCDLTGIERPFSAFLDWRFSWDQFELLASEVMTYDTYRNGYAGTADIIARLNNEVWLIDLKTSPRIYDEYGMQLAAYQYALSWCDQFDITKTGILRLDKNSGAVEWKVYRYEETERYHKMFSHLCDFWWVKHRWQN